MAQVYYDLAKWLQWLGVKICLHFYLFILSTLKWPGGFLSHNQPNEETSHIILSVD